MFWNILLLCVFWVLGIFTYSLGIVQIILTLTCAIPLTRRIVSQCKCLVDKKGLYTSITMTIMIWTILSTLIIIAILIWGNSYVTIGFFIGMVISFLISLKKLGINEDNFNDYFTTKGKYYARKDLIELGIIQETEE